MGKERFDDLKLKSSKSKGLKHNKPPNLKKGTKMTGAKKMTLRRELLAQNTIRRRDGSQRRSSKELVRVGTDYDTMDDTDPDFEDDGFGGRSKLRLVSGSSSSSGRSGANSSFIKEFAEYKPLM